MQYSPLGRSGCQISRLGLGTMNFADCTAPKESYEILDAAVEAGINFIDTANWYGGQSGRGATEELLGTWLKDRPGLRQKLVLGTKVFCPMGEGPNEGGLSALHIKRAVEASLKRLGIETIDLYQMHHIDRQTPWDEIWQAMDQLVQEGKVIYIGSSNFAAWNIAQANERALSRKSLGLVSEQSIYHLAQRQIELEVLPCCRAMGIGLLPWSPLGGGLLAGEPQRESSARRVQREDQKQMRKTFEGSLRDYHQFCQKKGSSPAQVALAWLLSREGVVAPVLGPRTLNQFKEALPSLDLNLSAEELRELDRIWPGPPAEAPEAYAW